MIIPGIIASRPIPSGLAAPQYLIVSAPWANMAVYDWDNTSGIGSFISSTTGTASYNFNLSTDKQAVFIHHIGTPYLSARTFDINTGTIGANGSYTNPTGLTAGTTNTDFGVNGDTSGIIIVGENGSSGAQVFPWDSVTGFGAKFASGMPVAGTLYPILKSNRAAIIAGGTTGSGIGACEWDDVTGFGTQYSNPAVGAGNSNVRGLFFSSTEDRVTIVKQSTPFLHTYLWDDITGFGTKHSNPVGVPGSGSCYGYDISADKNTIVFVHGSSPFIHAYPIDDFSYGTKYADPSVLASAPTTAGSRYLVRFSPTGGAVIMITSTSPYIHAWEWNNVTGFGAKYPDPATIPVNTPTYLGFANDGKTIVATNPFTKPLINTWSWDDATGFGSASDSGPAFVTAGGGVVYAHFV